jgi:UDP-N-acetylmuramoyl-L-alanyl-D-glutamate--2,6-diaminopimelate ligase
VAEVVSWLAESGCEPDVAGDTAVRLTGLGLSSQRVRPGDLYVALPGTHAHGAQYADQALRAGARAVLTDRAGIDLLPASTTSITVDQPRAILGRLSAWLYGDPAQAMTLIGVTGTQGKTTTTWLAEGALQTGGVTAAVVGTVGTRICGIDVKTALTTPEAPDLHALFAVMREQAVEVCLMEVSSHALVLGRVDAVRFDLAVFTNLGRDHLDFHRDLEDYFAAKATLFTPDHAKRGLVNLDDPYGRRLLSDASIPMRTFSADPGRLSGPELPADWQALSVATSPSGSLAVVRTPGGGEIDLRVPMPGHFNVANALAALAACAEVGIDPALVAVGIRDGGGVPGRMEWISTGTEFPGREFGVVVDYAHKPDALRAALSSLRERDPRRLIVVMGAGGDRDQGKRQIMGEVAAELADVVVITDDNPRSEDPAAIRAAIRRGTTRGRARVEEIADRGDAIAAAIGAASSGDVVLIAGKGHETGQEVAGVVSAFDDRVVAREALSA